MGARGDDGEFGPNGFQVLVTGYILYVTLNAYACLLLVRYNIYTPLRIRGF